MILQEFMLELCEVAWGQRHRAGAGPTFKGLRIWVGKQEAKKERERTGGSMLEAGAVENKVGRNGGLFSCRLMMVLAPRLSWAVSGLTLSEHGLSGAPGTF